MISEGFADVYEEMLSGMNVRQSNGRCDREQRRSRGGENEGRRCEDERRDWEGR